MRFILSFLLIFHSVFGEAAPVFVTRSSDTSFNAHYAPGLHQGQRTNQSFIVNTSDNLAFGSTAWDFQNTAQVKKLTFSGKFNLCTTRACSLQMRVSPQYSGSPSNRRALFSIGTGGAAGPYVTAYHDTTGQVVIGITSETATVVNFVNMGLWAPVSGVWYDLGFTWDGDVVANNVRFYLNAVQTGTATPTGSLSTNISSTYYDEFQLGVANTGASVSLYRVNEVVIFNGSTDFTQSFTFTNGSGTFNGQGRQALGYYSISAFNGLVSTDPGVANVLDTASYTINGVAKTGTWAALLASQAKIGVSFGPSGSLTGTYDGSDRWSSPSTAAVLTTQSWKENSTSDNRTGTYTDVGAATNVKHDVVYGNGLTGSYRGLDLFDVLAVSNVRNGTSYLSNGDTLVGTLDAVTISNSMCVMTGNSRNTRATGVVR